MRQTKISTHITRIIFQSLSTSSLCNLCVLCVSVVSFTANSVNHRDTENAEVAQRRAICLNRFGFNRQFRFFPTIPAADQRSGFGPSSLSEFLRHTGAGSFVWSSAVGNQPRLLGKVQVLCLCHYVLRRHAH